MTRRRACLRFDELSVRSQWVSGQASGTAALGGLEDGGRVFSDLVGQFNLQKPARKPR